MSVVVPRSVGVREGDGGERPLEQAPRGWRVDPLTSPPPEGEGPERKGALTPALSPCGERGPEIGRGRPSGGLFVS